MGMHATLYRWFFRAHSVKSLERNILRFLGLAPVRETLIGMVENMDETKFQEWTGKLESLGATAQ
jgi:putative NADPH-quinone reductase